MTIHVTGSGIASLAAAVFMIRDAGVAPGDIRIYEESNDVGGAMAIHGDPINGYVLPATRVLEREYGCTLDLFSHFPSLADPQETIEEADALEFNREFPYRDKARLLDGHQRVYAARHFGVSVIDQLNALKLLAIPERARRQGHRSLLHARLLPVGIFPRLVDFYGAAAAHGGSSSGVTCLGSCTSCPSSPR